MNVHYPFFNDPLPLSVVRTLERDHISLQVLQTNPHWQAVQILLLPSPILNERGCLLPDALWKHFLQHEQPHVKLITLGLERKSGVNYLDAFELPTNLPAFFAAAQTAGADWQPVTTFGAPIEAEFQAFFLGHGKESILKVLSQLQYEVELIEFELQQTNEMLPSKENPIYQNIAQAIAYWKILNLRWYKYEWLFSYVPFYYLLQKVDNYLVQIRPFFENPTQNLQMFKTLQVSFILVEIISLLNKIGNYVFDQELSYSAY